MLKTLKKHLKNEKGLTLIELLAVVVILGIIAAIAIPSIGGLIQNTREDALKADAITVINAAKTYVASNGLPSDGTDKTVTATDLAPYVDEVDLTNNASKSYSVLVESSSTGKATYKLTGEGKAGKITIVFTKATVDDINKAKDGAEAIPAAASTTGS